MLAAASALLAGIAQLAMLASRANLALPDILPVRAAFLAHAATILQLAMWAAVAYVAGSLPKTMSASGQSLLLLLPHPTANQGQVGRAKLLARCKRWCIRWHHRQA